MPIRWVIFDVGETLVSERRSYDEWADWLGVPRDAFWAELRQVISERLEHGIVMQRLHPGFDLVEQRKLRAAAGRADRIDTSDLYDDVLPTIHELARKGLKIGVAGNQPVQTVDFIAKLDAPIDLIGMSADWNVKKPSLEFFDKIIELAGAAAHEIAYVGDRLDNDVLPAQAAGMVGIFFVRGPWGESHAGWPEAAEAHFTISSLRELPGLFESAV